MNYFFVFQNKTFKEEHLGGFLWAPKADKNGHTKSHWTMMTNVKKGDVIIHSVHKAIVAISFAISDCYSSSRPDTNFNDWEEDGWRVDTEYRTFQKSILTSDYIDELRKLQPEKYAPFNSRGRGNTGYLFAANAEMFRLIIEETAKVQSSYSYSNQVLELLKTSSDKVLEELSEYSPGLIVESIKSADLKNESNYFKHKGTPKEKQSPIYSNGQKSYPRDRQTALNALAHAHYLCEVDKSHPTFIRKNSDKSYTEPHHLVPMAYSDNFNVSLDVEENIVSLCSNCHNQVHYGEGAEGILRKLYSERKEVLERVGIEVTLKELLQMYSYGLGFFEL
ncbi:HNH endonuclease [Andreesenia angusta]|uniref:HNH endonuclease n=1 Tax=Andreesenia angusta TaxID=39480 RepID=A0A1S1VAC7_9FIRM|nr:HNH endonuclease [Andreesenia angusta]OHW63573.1 HNH endonuclease [Andreesenia angusta]